MRGHTISKSLLVLGALVGCVTGVALALGLRLDHLPPWMITVGMYKLAFVAAGGLLLAGAVLGRAAHNASRRREHTDAEVQLLGGSGPEMESGKLSREPDPVNRDRRSR